jgi:HAMP domain-containing protein
VVSVAAGILLVMLLMYFIMAYYVNPLYKMSAGVDNYRTMSKRHVYTFDGEDQLANINTGLTELIDENLELKKRVKTLREEREKLMSANQTSQEV